MKRTLLLLLFALSLSYLGWGQATLPFTYDGGRPTAVTGLTHTGLGTDYAASPKMKFDTSTDNLILNFTGSPGTLSFSIKWNQSTSAARFPGDFELLESPDGSTYTRVQLYNATTGTALVNGTVYTETFTALLSATRYIKWNYTAKSNGNIAIGAIVLAAPAGSTEPSVSTQAVSSIGVTTATGNGNITSTGGVNPHTRGVCWVLFSNGSDPTTSDSKVEETGGSFGTGAFTESMTTNLAAETRYKLKAYATNTVGTGYGSLVNFWTLSAEPSAHSSTFGNTPVSQTQIDLSFDAASTITNADGYLILRKTGSGPTGLPTDGNSYSVGTDIGDATVAAIITSSSSTSTSVTSLSAGTSYYFELIPYNYNGNDGATYNYKIDGSIPGTNGSTLAPLDVNSKVEAPTSQTIASNIASIATGSGSAVEVFKFKISDLASGDVAATKVTQVKIKKLSGTADWTDHIAGASLWDGVSQISTGTVVITDADITFPITSGNLDIASGSTKEIALKIWLNTTNIVDNSTMVFTVSQTSHGFTADAVASTFASDFGAAVTGNTMTVSVEATKLAFVQQPTNVGTSANITPAVTVSANDANNNRDLDYVTNVAVSATGLTGSPVSVTPTAGLATFSTLSFAAAATGVTLDASSGSLTNSTSSSFDVLLLPAPGEIVINQISPDYSGASDEYIELVNRTNKTFDLSQLKIEYQSATGSSGSAGGNLTGSLGPYQYWLLSPNATITVGQISGLSRNGSITAGFAAASGQLALRLKNSPNTIIDGIAYGSVSTNNLGEGTSTASPPADGGLKRVSEGIDNNANSTDFTTVAQANIYLRNSNSVCVASTYTLPSTSYPADVVISGAAPAVTLTSNTTIAGKLIVASGSLTVGSSQTLTVTGTLSNNAGTTGLVVESGGSLITGSAVSAIVKRAIDARVPDYQGWHMISSPVAAQAFQSNFVSNPPSSNEDFYLWDETTNYWINSKLGTDPDFTFNSGVFTSNFVVGKGYLAAYGSTSTKEFAGVLNTATQALTITYTSGSYRHGWNLLGNPFTSGITWNATTWGDPTNVGGVAKIILSSDGSYQDINADEVIPAMNGFFVHAKAATSALSIPASSKVHSGTWYKSTSDIKNITLIARDIEGQTAQRSCVRINPEATSGFDFSYDGEFVAFYAPKFYSVVGDNNLSTNSLPELTNETVVNFGFVKNAGSQYKIEVEGLEGIGAIAYLLDLKTGTTQNLSINPVYSFTAAEGDDANRFKLSFGSVGIENPETKDAGIYTYGNKLNIQNPGKATLEVYTMSGQRMLVQEINGTGLYQTSLTGATGYYVVRLTNAGNVRVAKVFIK